MRTINSQKGTTKIKWTANEQQTVGKKAEELINTGAQKRWSKAIIEAQKLVLPKNRQKPESSVYGATTKQVEAQMKNGNKRSLMDVRPHYEFSKPGEPIVVAPEVKEEEVIPAPTVVEYQSNFNAALIDTVDRIATSFRDMLKQRLTQAANEAFQEAEEEFKKSIKQVSKNIVRRLPKVALCGLMPNQANEIRKEFSSFFDLVFVGADEKTTRLKDVSVNADFVVLDTKFISHQHQEQVRKHKGLHMVNGGVSAIKDKLVELTYQ